MGAGLKAAAPSAAAAAKASNKEAAATVWLTRAAAKEEVVTVVGSTAAVKSPSMPDGAHSRTTLQPAFGRQERTGSALFHSLTGKSLDAWIGVVAVLAPTTAHTAATQWPNYCQEPMLPCSANKIFNNLIFLENAMSV